jgi:membrane-bound lytic murein transglycosylase MltF
MNSITPALSAYAKPTLDDVVIVLTFGGSEIMTWHVPEEYHAVLRARMGTFVENQNRDAFVERFVADKLHRLFTLADRFTTEEDLPR